MFGKNTEYFERDLSDEPLNQFHNSKYFDEQFEKRVQENIKKNKEQNNFIQSYENGEKVDCISDNILNFIYRKIKNLFN
ncbi:hypothetical protein LR002_00675 [Candidatus Gracilibacteria bacterium]|nr:hypothetical protein [Candidatus Gracilibacteria bacterium]